MAIVKVMPVSKTQKVQEWCDENITEIYLSMRDGGLNGNRINKIMKRLKKLEDIVR